jgi:hypothetical protein
MRMTEDDPDEYDEHENDDECWTPRFRRLILNFARQAPVGEACRGLFVCLESASLLLCTMINQYSG